MFTVNMGINNLSPQINNLLFSFTMKSFLFIVELNQI